MIDIYTKAVNNQSASVKGKLSVYLTPLVIQPFQVGEHNKNPSQPFAHDGFYRTIRFCVIYPIRKSRSACPENLFQRFIKEEPRLFALGISENVRGSTLFLYHAVGDIDYPIRDVFRKFHLMSNDYHRHITVFKALYDIKHLARQFGIKSTRRFVEAKYIGMQRKRAGDRNSLLLTSGKLGRVAFHLVDKAYPFEQ